MKSKFVREILRFPAGNARYGEEGARAKRFNAQTEYSSVVGRLGRSAAACSLASGAFELVIFMFYASTINATAIHTMGKHANNHLSSHEQKMVLGMLLSGFSL